MNSTPYANPKEIYFEEKALPCQGGGFRRFERVGDEKFNNYLHVFSTFYQLLLLTDLIGIINIEQG